MTNVKYYRDEKIAIIHLGTGDLVVKVGDIICIAQNPGTGGGFIEEVEVDSEMPFDQLFESLPITTDKFAKMWESHQDSSLRSE